MENLLKSLESLVSLFFRALFPRKSVVEGNEAGIDAPGYDGVTKDQMASLDRRMQDSFQPEQGDLSRLGGF